MMKKVICLIIALCLVFSSFSFVFAVDWNTTDQTNLSNVASRLSYGSQSAARWLSDIYDLLRTSSGAGIANVAINIYNRLYGINGLYNDVSNLLTYSFHINNNLLDIKGLVTDIHNNNNATILNKILGALTYTTGNSSLGSWLADIYTDITPLHQDNLNLYSIFNRNGYSYFNPSSIAWLKPGANGTYETIRRDRSNTNWIDNILGRLNYIDEDIVHIYEYTYAYQAKGYNATQSVLNWGNLSNKSFTPQSSTDGIYKYLAAIQAPVARLSYVLANDQEIEARDAAAANQEAVVDNFIDSSGAGSVSTTDIGSLSSAADSYKTNASTGASATGVWSVFNESNYNWFSRTTVNNLDTSNNTRKAAAHYETPLLDSYYSYMTDYLKENPDD